MKMTSIVPGYKVTACNVRKTFKGQFQNAFKVGNGRVLQNPIVLETDEGTWGITKITSATWVGPAVLVAHIEVRPPIETLTGIKHARLELDFRKKDHDVELVITRPR